MYAQIRGRNVRSVEEFDTVLLLSASARTPLLALFTASWCPSCKTVAPLLRELVGDDGVGESHGGVAYAEIESDAPDVAGLAGRYVVTSLPTLMAFSRQEPQMATRLAAVRDLTDRGFLTAWIEREATRGGAGGAGGASGPFGAIASLFGR
ncbi:MAG: hypothetical protein M1832_002290 [Thelocarpon impressellum]|nr:MAG: hypothetical protein M1832_002290 [Thelocarpon impressellum]